MANLSTLLGTQFGVGVGGNINLTSQVTGTLPAANGGTGQTTPIFGGGLIKVELVTALPASPNSNTLYIVTG